MLPPPLCALHLFAGRHQFVLLRLGGESQEILQRSVHVSQQHQHKIRTSRTSSRLVTRVSVSVVYHVLGEEVQLRPVEPLAALLAALQHLFPWGKDGVSHFTQAHGLLGEQRSRFTGFKHEH